MDEKQSEVRERYRSRRQRSSESRKQGKIREYYLSNGVALGLGFGVAIGAGFGIAFGNLPLGVGFGICLGTTLGIVVGSILGNKHAKVAQEPSDTDGGRNA